MTFSKVWDKTYKEGAQMSVWPWSDLISHVMRHARPTGVRFRVLEVGCGAGANIPFFLELGVEYYGIDGSPAIIKNLQKRFPKLKKRLIAGDFTRSLYFKGPFDLVVDRSSITHNATAAVKKTLRMIREHLAPGGKYVGIDWFSTLDGDYPEGRPAGDANTKTFTNGRFSRVGRIHFSDRRHLERLFADFQIISLEHKIVKRFLPRGAGDLAFWNLVAARRDS
jgi:SAM-dependent methyltransferase